MEFFTDGRVKRSNDQGIVLLDTYAVSNGMVTVTSPSPMGNHILEFRIEQDRLVLSSGEIFYKQGTLNANAASGPSTPAIIPVDADRAEVLKQAETKWKTIWVQNGDTWIAKHKDYPYLVEIKGRRLEVNAGVLSEIDRLNGIQWHGIVVVSCSAERKFAFQSSEGTISGLSDPYQAGWNDWSTPQDAAAAYRFRKKNDQWASLKLETFDTGSLRGEMVRPRAGELAAAGIKTISQDSDQDPGVSGQNHSVDLNNPSQNATGDNRAATVFVGERFPQTRTRALATADIQAWSDGQLQYAINEMFARHGAEFGNRAVVKWFAQFPWYKPQPGLSFDDIERAMSELERQNLRFLGEYRTARKGAPNQPPLNARNQHGKGTRDKQNQTRPDPVAQKFLESILQGVVQGLENSH